MINWKVRFRNKKWVTFFVGQVLAFVYATCASLGIELPIPENTATKVAIAFIGILGLLGVVIDPTTKGMGDSDQAMTYTRPKDDSQKGEIRPVANDKAINYEDIKEGLKDAEVLEDGR